MWFVMFCEYYKVVTKACLDKTLAFGSTKTLPIEYPNLSRQLCFLQWKIATLVLFLYV